MSTRSCGARPELIDCGGTGVPILLLHGLMGAAATWAPVARWLTGHGRVVAADARAHGRHPIREAAPTESLIDDAAAILRAIGAGPAVVLGHSMGALHALGLAARHPELVRAVVAEDAAVDLRDRSVEAWRGFFDAWPATFASLAHVRQHFGEYGDYFAECVEPCAGGYRLMAETEQLYTIAGEWTQRHYWSYVDMMRCPLLVIEAEHTPMPPGQQAEIARRAGGSHARVPGAGHLVHVDAPETYRRLVQRFLDEVLTAPAAASTLPSNAHQ